MNRVTSQIPAVLITATVLLVSGCDDTYKYLFHPPKLVEYTLEPDPGMMRTLTDSAYGLSRDSLSIVYNAGTYKVEVKYVSDYQLNEVEFRQESQDGAFSANPFTYANWVDPQLGFTPNRFSVFRVSIYNYSAPKLNFDPERSFLVSDRGDLFSGYGREEKTSKNFSLEAYYKRRKGASGVEDEIFERRMGIIRSTVLYLGRPIYAGDNREGFVVFDPLPEGVERAKVVLKDFILGYDENNEPSEFRDLTFFFRRVPLQRERVRPRTTAADTASERELRSMTIYQLRYQGPGERQTTIGQEDWNALPSALPAFTRFLRDSLAIKAEIVPVQGESRDLQNAKFIILLAGPTEPVFQPSEIAGIAEALKGGATLFIDNASFSTKYKHSERGDQLLDVLAAAVGDARVVQCALDHPVFTAWKRLGSIPEGMDDRENLPDRRDYLTALVRNNRTIAVLSTKGYSMVWGRDDGRSAPQLTLGANLVTYSLAQ